jgi:hypothetical protein
MCLNIELSLILTVLSVVSRITRITYSTPPRCPQPIIENNASFKVAVILHTYTPAEVINTLARWLPRYLVY